MLTIWLTLNITRQISNDPSSSVEFYTVYSLMQDLHYDGEYYFVMGICHALEHIAVLPRGKIIQKNAEKKENQLGVECLSVEMCFPQGFKPR